MYIAEVYDRIKMRFDEICNLSWHLLQNIVNRQVFYYTGWAENHFLTNPDCSRNFNILEKLCLNFDLILRSNEIDFFLYFDY